MSSRGLIIWFHQKTWCIQICWKSLYWTTFVSIPAYRIYKIQFVLFSTLGFFIFLNNKYRKYQTCFELIRQPWSVLYVERIDLLNSIFFRDDIHTIFAYLRRQNRSVCGLSEFQDRSQRVCIICRKYNMVGCVRNANNFALLSQMLVILTHKMLNLRFPFREKSTTCIIITVHSSYSYYLYQWA